VHVIADNAGTELTLDLVLADAILSELDAPVVVHLKAHPTFVSDATVVDVERFLGRDVELAALPAGGGAFFQRLAGAHREGRLVLADHPFWNGPCSLWELPPDLVEIFASARLVVLKGDANYRRALGDALWPSTTPFREITSYFPAPLLALRTLKRDTIAGLAEGVEASLDLLDPSWRVNGRRGLASLGGRE
jgi:hypothetical protein